MDFMVISIWLGFSWLAFDLWIASRHKNYKEVTLDELVDGGKM